MKKAENKEMKKKYPLLPYLVGLFITVVALVLLSYLAELRNNKQELINYSEYPGYTIEDTIIDVTW